MMYEFNLLQKKLLKMLNIQQLFIQMNGYDTITLKNYINIM